jgi:hypothetical protein
MELPEDVLLLVRAYAKPSEPYKMYTRIMKIFVEKLPLGLNKSMPRKLKMATRFHYERFLPIFLKLEKTHDELVISAKAVSINDTSRYTESELRTIYTRKLKALTRINADVLTRLMDL